MTEQNNLKTFSPKILKKYLEHQLDEMIDTFYLKEQLEELEEISTRTKKLIKELGEAIEMIEKTS